MAELNGAQEDLLKWRRWADELTGHKHYLDSAMRRDIAAQLESLKSEKVAAKQELSGVIEFAIQGLTGGEDYDEQC